LDVTTGPTVNYTAPQTPGTYTLTAQLEALPGVTQSANVVVGGSQPAIPIIMNYTFDSTPTANQPFGVTITGSGFAPPLSVFFCMTGTSTCFQHPPGGVTVNNPQSLSLMNVQLSSGSWQFYIQTGAGQSALSKSFSVQASAPIPNISGYTWDSTPAANQPFGGTITGTGFLSPVSVFFCINASNTCFQHPAAGVKVIGSDILSLVNIQLGSGSYQIYVQTSGGQSSRSTPFPVQAVPAPTITGYIFNATPTAQQPFNGSVTGTGFVQGIQVFFCVNLSSTCYEHPSAGIAVNSASSLSLTNVNLGAGMWQMYVQTSNGQSGRSTAFTVQSETPTTTGISPTSTPGSTNSFSLTINGSNFDPSVALIAVTGPGCSPCTVPNNVLAIKTSTQIVGPVTIFNPGTYNIAIQNGSGGPTSNTQTLTVNAPSTSGISPTSITASTNSFSLTINGNNFDPSGAIIVVTGPGCSSCTVPNNVLTTKTGSQIVGPVTIFNPGTYGIAIQNGVNGPVSNRQSLSVN
jgi:hypothetical protein